MPPHPNAQSASAPPHPAADRSIHPPSTRRIILLGCTGSVGTQTAETIDHLNTLAARGEYPTWFEVVGLAAGSNAAGLAEMAARYPGARLALANGNGCANDAKLPASTLRGADAALELVRSTPSDLVLAAMVGAAGLPATLEAVSRGIDVALANKETLVAAGELVVPAALKSGARLLPVDSEHSALWQCLQGRHGATPPQTRSHEGKEGNGEMDGACCPPFAAPPACVSRLVLTASGGPFRTWPREKIAAATPAEALKHPTWTMGRKVTIDCASLTNKGLEVLEAHWLYAMPAERLGVLVHPQSIVHSLVEYADGSVIAQLGSPDMRVPIQYALTFPQRPEGVARKLDWRALSKLDFEEPDLERFPALGLAFDVIRAGGTAGAVFNAANEAAVEAFLASADSAPGGSGGSSGSAVPAVPFGLIPELTARALREVGTSPIRSLDDVLAADREARAFVQRELAAVNT